MASPGGTVPWNAASGLGDVGLARALRAQPFFWLLTASFFALLFAMTTESMQRAVLVIRQPISKPKIPRALALAAALEMRIK